LSNLEKLSIYTAFNFTEKRREEQHDSKSVKIAIIATLGKTDPIDRPAYELIFWI
jgi:hypothetical protein